MKKTLKQAAADAVQVQDACNTSGIARSMVDAIDAIRDAGGSPRQHPIVFLFLYKLMALQGHEPMHLETEYWAAVTACREIEAGGAPVQGQENAAVVL